MTVIAKRYVTVCRVIIGFIHPYIIGSQWKIVTSNSCNAELIDFSFVFFVFKWMLLIKLKNTYKGQQRWTDIPTLPIGQQIKLLMEIQTRPLPEDHVPWCPFLETTNQFGWMCNCNDSSTLHTLKSTSEMNWVCWIRYYVFKAQKTQENGKKIDETVLYLCIYYSLCVKFRSV